MQRNAFDRLESKSYTEVGKLFLLNARCDHTGPFCQKIVRRMSETRGCANVESFQTGLGKGEGDNRQREKRRWLQCGDSDLLDREAQAGILAKHVPLAGRTIRAAREGEVVVIVQQVDSDADAAVGQQDQGQEGRKRQTATMS